MTQTLNNNLFGSKEWRDDFLKQQSITSIIDKIDIGDYSFHRLEKSYTVNDDRIGAIVQIKKDERTLRAIIDFKRGNAMWNQIIDVKFNIGNDCDYYIIIHGDSRNFHDYKDHTDDWEDSKYLVDVLLAYRVKVYTVCAERQSDEQDKVIYKYSCAPGQTYSSETFSEKLPSKRAFEEAEFMIFHWGASFIGFNESLFKPSEWFCGRGGNLQMGGIYMKDLDLFSNWSDSGLFMNAKPKSNEGIGMLEWIWEKNGRQELRDNYKGCKIRMYKKNGRPSKLSIRLLDKPFKEVAALNYEERGDYGELVYFQESTFGEVIDNLVHDKPSMKMAVNS